MEIRDNESLYIIAPLNPKLDTRECERIFANFNAEQEKEIALDLSFVQDCTIDFIETLKNYSQKRHISVFNVPSDIFVLFNYMGIDKFVKLFVSEFDFGENKRRLINRTLRLA